MDYTPNKKENMCVAQGPLFTFNKQDLLNELIKEAS